MARVGVVVPCCVKSYWRVRLVPSPRSLSGFDGVALFTAGSLSCVYLAVAVAGVRMTLFLCLKLGFSWAIGLIPCLKVVYSGEVCPSNPNALYGSWVKGM